MGLPTSSSIRSSAFLCALTCFLVTGMPPMPCGVPSIRPSMWDWPMWRMTIRWSAPCHAAILIRRTSSSNLPDAISVVMVGMGCGSRPSKYLAGGRGTPCFKGSEMSWYSNGPMCMSFAGFLQVQPRLLGSYLSRSFSSSTTSSFSLGFNGSMLIYLL